MSPGWCLRYYELCVMCPTIGGSKVISGCRSSIAQSSLQALWIIAEQKCLKAPAQEILVERAEMEAIQKDSSRLTARGRGASANLKREMGMQDRIKKLPKLTEVPQIYHLSRLHTLLKTKSGIGGPAWVR